MYAVLNPNPLYCMRFVCVCVCVCVCVTHSSPVWIAVVSVDSIVDHVEVGIEH